MLWQKSTSPIGLKSFERSKRQISTSAFISFSKIRRLSIEMPIRIVMFFTQRELDWDCWEVDWTQMLLSMANISKRWDSLSWFKDYDSYPYWPTAVWLISRACWKMVLRLEIYWGRSPKSIKLRQHKFLNHRKRYQSQYGGCSADRIDEILAPYAEKNYQKHLKDAEEWVLQ